MDKRIAALLGATAAVAAINGAQAATQPNPSEALLASSYTDLLAPVPNAVQQLQADSAVRAQMPAEQGVKLARNHHHHHNTVIIRRGRNYHHHHYHGAFIGIPGMGGVTVGSGNNHRHHHHHYRYYGHRD